MSTTKQQIARAFERRLTAAGYDRTTLDDVARELHISKKTIYVHFDSKRDIYAYLVAGQAAREKLRLAAAVATLPSYAARVEALMRLVIGSARAHINKTGRDEWLREYEIAADAFRQANGELLRELIGAGMAAGEFAPGDTVFVERAIAAMLLDYLVGVNEDPSVDHDAELIERILKFLQ
ncbi:MAG: helix-turn-helix domain-containing protein [Coriobacteriia bacterium]|nr:helix-turn-helix domain-containing protein [Actinomycetota bacterium]MDZ4166572.1 helix-turn-helix domain-containing protein [Coriobacteriia bacterium]